MSERRKGRWTADEDELFRQMAAASIRPEIIAEKLNRPVDAVKVRAYAIGLPLKWFRPNDPCKVSPVKNSEAIDTSL